MNRYEYGLASISRQDWSFDRRGIRDEERHNEKVKESIKDKLGDIVSDGTIITADPNTKKKIKIPMRSLELPRFRFGDEDEGMGTGDGSEEAGDLVDGEGNGSEAGDKPGEEYYEAEMSIEEIQALVFEDLGLPNIQQRDKDAMEAEEVVFNDIRKNRAGVNIDMGRTVLQNLLRNAQETGVARIGGISPDDYRVRRWEEEKKPINNAVVIAMADISASMGEFEKYVTRAFCWWTVAFLRTKYPSVDIVFIAHDTEAYEVSEEQFFTRGMGGGTKCSSANKMAVDLTKDRYPTSRYNVYPLHFSDGDNWGGGDNELCVDLVQQMLDDDINQYAYVHIDSRNRGPSGLLKEYQSSLHDDRFKGVVINQKEDVLDALQQVFSPDEGASR